MQRLDHRGGCLEAAFLEVCERARVGAGQNGKERINKLYALRLGELPQERSERLVYDFAALGELCQVLEALALDLPRKAVVLHEADLRAAHDLIGLLVLEQHPDNRRFRQQCRDLSGNRLVFRKGQQGGIKAGAVVIVDGKDPFLHLLTAEDRCVDR